VVDSTVGDGVGDTCVGNSAAGSCGGGEVGLGSEPDIGADATGCGVGVVSAGADGEVVFISGAGFLTSSIPLL
jgi:hypothetical protein